MSSLGDVVHNMPLVHDLRARWPDAEIDWVVEEGYVELVRLLPEVRRVIPFALRRWRKRILQGGTWHEVGAVRDALRQERYDAVIESQGLLKTAVVARVAARAPGAPIIGLGNATQARAMSRRRGCYTPIRCACRARRIRCGARACWAQR